MKRLYNIIVQFMQEEEKDAVAKIEHVDIKSLKKIEEQEDIIKL